MVMMNNVMVVDMMMMRRRWGRKSRVMMRRCLSRRCVHMMLLLMWGRRGRGRMSMWLKYLLHMQTPVSISVTLSVPVTLNPMNLSISLPVVSLSQFISFPSNIPPLSPILINFHDHSHSGPPAATLFSRTNTNIDRRDAPPHPMYLISRRSMHPHPTLRPEVLMMVMVVMPQVLFYKLSLRWGRCRWRGRRW
jgi:hypothetical protein